jgi:hypothetical protein
VFAERPGLEPPVQIALGRYLCVLNFDKIVNRPHPWALHLSISNWIAPVHRPPLDERWLLSLFFPAYEPELNAC